MGGDGGDQLRGDLRRSSLGGAGAVQHRGRRLRQARAYQAGDDLGELRRVDPRARVGRAAGLGEVRPRTRSPHAVSRRETAWQSCCRRRLGRCRLLRSLEARRDSALDVRVVRRRWHRASALGLGSDVARHGPRAMHRASSDLGRLPRSCSSPTRWQQRRRISCAPTPRPTTLRSCTTSGTTGLAKGIVHAHRYILGHEEFRYPRCTGRRALSRDGRMGLGREDRTVARSWRLGALQCVYRREAASTRTSSSTSEPGTR